MTRYILRLCVIVLAVLPVYLLLRKPWKKMRVRELLFGCFVLFHIGLLALALEGEYGNPVRMFCDGVDRLKRGVRINLIPFHTIGYYFSHFDLDAFMINIVGNIVMFIPWGFGLPMLWRRKQNLVSVGSCCLMLPLFIETSQLFIGRNVDVDDLILNFLGGCLGAGTYVFFRMKVPQIARLAE